MHPKVTAGVVAGAIVGLLVAEATRRGIPIAADEASDLTVLVSFATGYFVSSNGSDAPRVAPPGAGGFVPAQPPAG